MLHVFACRLYMLHVVIFACRCYEKKLLNFQVWAGLNQTCRQSIESYPGRDRQRAVCRPAGRVVSTARLKRTMATSHHHLQRTIATSHGDCSSTGRLQRTIATARCGSNRTAQLQRTIGAPWHGRMQCGQSFGCSVGTASSAWAQRALRLRGHSELCSAWASSALRGLCVGSALRGLCVGSELCSAWALRGHSELCSAWAQRALRLTLEHRHRVHAAPRMCHGILTACGFAQRHSGCAAMALLHTSCAFDQCTCEAAVEGSVDSAPSSPCGAGRSLPSTSGQLLKVLTPARAHMTGTRRQSLSSIARCYRSSACAAVWRCSVLPRKHACSSLQHACWVLEHVDQFRVFQLPQYHVKIWPVFFRPTGPGPRFESKVMARVTRVRA
jgi:hypothetical protein